jgi:hypothetical protein
MFNFKFTRKFQGTLPQGARDGVAITPDDDNDLDVVPDAIFVGVSGNIEVDVKSGTLVYPNVPVGIFPISPTRVRDANTTATNLIAMYYN